MGHAKEDTLLKRKAQKGMINVYKNVKKNVKKNKQHSLSGIMGLQTNETKVELYWYAMHQFF